MKKFLSFLLALVLVFSLGSVAVASEQEYSEYAELTYEDIFFPEDLLEDEVFVAALNEQLVEKFGAAFMENQEQALALREELLGSFPMNRAGDVIYPDYFGGFFIDDNGNLVTMIVEEHSDYAGFAMVGARGMSVVPAQFSYSELNAVIAHLDGLSITRPDVIFSLSDGWGLNTIGNTVEVHLIYYSPAQEELFRTRVFDSPVISFLPAMNINSEPLEEQLDVLNYYDSAVMGIAPLNTTLRTGQLIFYGRVVGRSSLGYRARRNGQNGFVTHAHISTNGQWLGDSMRVNSTMHINSNTGTRIGTVAASSMVAVDAAFIRLEGAFAVEPHSTTPTAVDVPVVGMQVTSFGAVSGTRHGRVTRTGVTAIVNQHTLHQIVETDYRSQGGDSGGIVFRFGNPANHSLHGIHIASSANNSFYSRADRINSQLGLTLH